LLLAAGVLVIGTPVVLTVVAALSAPQAPPAPQAASGGPGTLDGPDASDESVDADGLAGPDPAELSGRDASWARLLGDVEDSEQAMLAFQRRVGSIAASAPESDRAEVLGQVRAAATDGARALAEVRPRLVAAEGDGPVERVRAAYLVHHDAWADYLDAVAEVPSLLGEAPTAQRWRLAIDSSGRTFARELRAAVDDDADPAVRAFARDILRRGFAEDRGSTDV
jgi:hypothetical protein